MNETEEILLALKDTKLIEKFKSYLNSISLCLFEFQSTNILSDDDDNNEITNVLNRFCFSSDVILMFMSMNRQNLTSKFILLLLINLSHLNNMTHIFFLY